VRLVFRHPSEIWDPVRHFVPSEDKNWIDCTVACPVPDRIKSGMTKRLRRCEELSDEAITILYVSNEIGALRSQRQQQVAPTFMVGELHAKRNP
jgi:hypothetical protein